MSNINQLQNDFLKELEESGKSFNTIKNYRTDLKCFSDYWQEKSLSLKVNEMTSTQITEYARYIENRYDSPNSRRRRIQALRLFFDFLIQKGLYSENPIRKLATSPKVVEIPNPAHYANILKLYTHLEDEANSENSMKSLMGLRNLMVIHLIYGCGLKVSDIHRLKMRQILKDKEGKYRILITPEKRDPFTVPTDPSFTNILGPYQSLLEEMKETSKIDFDDLLFNANPYRILAGALSPRGLELLFEDFSKLLDEKITPRSMRQSCIFKWLIAQTPEGQIKEWMNVRPQYSLTPFKKLLEEEADKFHFLPLGEVLQ